MPSKKWLDEAEDKARTMIKGPNTGQHDSAYWKNWGEFVCQYVETFTPSINLELVMSARHTQAELIETEPRDKDFFETVKFLYHSTSEELTWLENQCLINNIKFEDLFFRTNTIGFIGNREICISHRFVKWTSKIIGGWSVESKLADFDMIEQWHTKWFPNATLHEGSQIQYDFIRYQTNRKV